MKKITYLTMIFLFCNSMAFAQNNTALEKANKYLAEKGEVIFTFKANNQSQFLELNKILSVSHNHVDQQNLEVEAYANKQQFEKFLTYGLAFNVSESDNEIPTEVHSITGKTAATWDTTWNVYPKYSEYVAKMQYWAATYPSLCTLQSIGSTPNGRALYVLKISDNASSDETEPEFFYTSSMHGDEITGYPTMLRLIDYLLTNYGSLSEVTNLVDGTELFINPLANPDGSYKSVGNDIYNPGGATNTPTRGNAAGVDLNRNYPDAIGGMHPDGYSYQTETTAFLNFQATRNFVLSANYHGGTEVVNFPLDTSYTPGTGAFSYHPHDSYFKYISQEYASLCQTADGNLNYMDAVYNTGQFPGTTNGAAWYSVYGGRQDCSNYFEHNKEVTIEISNLKTPLQTDLPFFWDRNRQALLNYVKQASYGLHGVVTDASGNPIHAKVYVGGTADNFGSWVETSPSLGDYHKVQIAGTYNVIFEAPGYDSQTIAVTLTNGVTTTLNVIMVPTTATPTASNDVTICQGQTTTLTATGAGTIKWYNSQNATTPVATGTSYTTPALNSSTSYFTESEVTLANVGPTVASGTSSNNTAVANKYLIFDCTAPTKLKSVLVDASAAGQIYVELQNSSGVMLESKVVRLSASGSQDIDLDFFLPVENNLRLVLREISSTNLSVATSGITYPMTNGTVSVTANSGTGTFFPFFNWKFGPVKSNRAEVVVNVNPNPVLNTISPTTITSGSPDFTLTATGSNFVNGESILRWNGTDRTTTFVNATELNAIISAADIASGGTANITIFNTCNNESTPAQTITINSICTPVPDIVSLPILTGQCSATASAPTATSSCVGTVIGTTTNPLTYSTQGTFTVVWTYNDGSGNTSTQNQTVIIDDTIAPVADVASLPTATGQTSVTITAPTATDACAGSIIATTINPLNYSTQGTFTVVWTYDDGNGNTSTQNQTVIVSDTIAPTAPTGLVASATTASSTDLSWTASTDNSAVTEYEIYQGSTLTATTPSTNYTMTGLTANTAYTFFVKAKDAVGNLSSESNIASITTLDNTVSYCASQANSATSENIGKVILGSIDNNTSGGTGYEDYTNLSTNLSRSSTNTITITPSWQNKKRKEGYSVWIDYNGDGDFADAGEQVWTKTASTATSVSGTFTIPANATLGATRMRVSMKYNEIPTSCETFAFGQVEDYTVNLVSVAKGIDDINTPVANQKIILYPNPIIGNILNVSAVENNTPYLIANLLGQEVAKGRVENGSLSVSNLSPGIYLLKVISNNKTIVKRFIKE